MSISKLEIRVENDGCVSLFNVRLKFLLILVKHWNDVKFLPDIDIPRYALSYFFLFLGGYGNHSRIIYAVLRGFLRLMAKFPSLRHEYILWYESFWVWLYFIQSN